MSSRVMCSCGKEYTVSPSTTYFRCIQCNLRVNVKAREAIHLPSHWPALHNYPIEYWYDWDPQQACDWYLSWCNRIPSYGCNCRQHWQDYTSANPPYFTGPKAFFDWGWAAHNYVSANHSHKPTFTLPQAYGLYRSRGKYETQPCPNLEVDVVVPFWEGDKHYLIDVVRALLDQLHVKVHLHLIADGEVEFPQLPPHPGIRRYRGPAQTNVGPYLVTNDQASNGTKNVGPPSLSTSQASNGTKNVGPYLLTNALVAGNHLQTPYLALQDCDDLPVPDRLWRQLSTMKKFGYEMVSGGCENIATNNYTGNSHERYPTVMPWRTYDCVPKGHLVNSCRTLTVDLFKKMNGFAEGKCSMDFDFDNRVLHIEGNECIPVFGANEIDIVRRLHDDSLSNGPEYGLGTANRNNINKKVMDNLKKMIETPTLATARSLGDLDKAGQLQIIKD